MAKAPRPALRLVDRLVLLVAWLVTCGLVYVLGFYVGNRTQEHRAGLEEREVRLPVTSTPPPEGQRPKEAKEFPSFYQALPGGEHPVEIAQASTSTTTMSSATTLRATTTVPAGFVTTPTTLRAPGTTMPARPSGTPTTTAPAVPPATIARPVAPRGPSWTVEASPTRSRAEAEQLLATLRRRGYDAVLVQVQRDGDAWYRLRVGRYTSAEQANEVMRKLRDDGVPHAFVASE